MTAQRILEDLLAVLGGIPEDRDNYRSRREAIALTKALAAKLEAAS